ncbi:MAG: SpoIID/LytB domain-containing protein [Clostridia bacterium]|nr:SpoIID/LytB domain-containing protein [Clostridia bacterium]
MSNLKNKKRINWTRVLCFILAFLMVAGMATLGITIIISEISAVNVSYTESNYTFSSETDGDTYIAVGLMYGSSITVGFEIKAPYGFVIGSTVITDEERSFEPFYYLDTDIASVTVDDNLSKKSMTYSITDDPDTTVIGGYHLELVNTYHGSMPFEYLVDDVINQLDDDTLYPIPAYVGGEKRIRLGHFATEDEAYEMLEAYQNYFPDYELTVVSPSQTAVSVVNPETDVILFEYEAAEGVDTLGFMAYQADEYDSYIQTPADNLYEGVMTFIPRHTEDYTGVALTNLLDLESYVEGVLPYEISNSWSREVLRTFAITIRSYAIANYCKWYSRYGFDMTATTSDQVYRGRNRVNDAIVEAVTSTEGLVTVYDGKVISAYYSSSVGGSTVGSQYVWGSARGYLTTVHTPWEKYADYNNGLWYTEVTPEALCNTLRTKGGYTELSGAIASIEVETVENNSDYVYSLTVTDTSGNTVKINRSDAVRTTLSTYLKSANFTVGQGSLERTYDKVYDIKVVGGSGPIDTPDPEEPFSVKGYVTNDPLLISEALIIDESGEIMYSEYPVAYVLTSTGRKVSMNSCIATADNYDDVTPFEYDKNKVTLLDPEALPDDFDEYPETSFETEAETEDTEEIMDTETVKIDDSDPSDFSENAYEITSDYENVTIITTVETITETLTASSSKNFIFAGKGWGHGVGISQYGAKDLSDAGASAEDIISIYFTGVEIIHRSEIPDEEENITE